MNTTFSAEELRLLGVLIEKSMTTPDGYPLTINAMVAGCNQKQNRDPVVHYDEGTISRALRNLRQKGVVDQAPPSPGARSNRYLHRATEHFGWDRRELAIMTELMLRGPQTPGELRTRAGRMTPFQDVQSVVNILEGLKAGQTRFVEVLPREPGQSANRWRHLIGDGSERQPGPHAPGSPHPAGADSAALATQSADAPTPGVQPDGDTAARLAAIESRLDELVRRVDALERRLAEPNGQD
ncbi:MAG: DUF480 domain-containing protein [Phycisphaerales bacterium]|nr:MAG: DUF480 domain-containing protein [Phycisphaerales bacterium]